MSAVENTGLVKLGSSGLGSPHVPHGLLNSTTVIMPSVVSNGTDDVHELTRQNLYGNGNQQSATVINRILLDRAGWGR